MADIVAAFGVSHAAFMVRAWDQASPAQRAAVGGGYKAMSARLRAARPDVVLLVASDHFRSFFLDHMPAFCLGVGTRSVGWGDGSLPRYDLAVHDDLARGLLEGLIARGHDVAFARNLPLDHAFMTPVHLLFPQADIEPGLRVALIGTGGLSHEVPLHDWRTLPDDETGRAWLTFMSAGRTGADPETGKRIAAEVDRWGREGLGRIDEDFDRELLGWMQAGTYTRLADLDAATIARRGGNGGQEIRNWATVMGAVPDTRGEVLFYEAVPEWLTGVAGVAFG